jgi:hypothetical protein
VTPFTPRPDVIVRCRLDPRNGHLQVGGILRSIGGFASAGTNQQEVTGAGVAASGSLPLGKIHQGDLLLLEGSGGKGTARYVKDRSGEGLDAALDDQGHAKALGVESIVIGYQPVWTAALRSTFAVSVDRVENLSSQPADTYRQVKDGDRTRRIVSSSPFNTTL